MVNDLKNVGRLSEYLEYHRISQEIGDIDPSYDMLKYVADRFELTIEQRCWLSFLYACCYNAATVFYIYNEFPDYAGVDVGRLERWWNNNRDNLDFQTDCRWMRSRNQFVDCFVSYRTWFGENQMNSIINLMLDIEDGSDLDRYVAMYTYCSHIRHFGRFRLFLFLEALHVVTDLGIEPNTLPLETAESSRNGLMYAWGRDELLTGHDYARENINAAEMNFAYGCFNNLMTIMKHQFKDQRIDPWNVETTLCAYKKYHRGKRWPGYYITRQAKEIAKMQSQIKTGVCWDVLWDFRKERYPANVLIEKTGHDNNGKFWPKVEYGVKI